MATLKLKVSTTGDEFEVPDLDFSSTTPQDILENDDLGLPKVEAGKNYVMLRGSDIVELNKTLEEIGFKDGEEARIQQKVAGAK